MADLDLMRDFVNSADLEEQRDELERCARASSAGSPHIVSREPMPAQGTADAADARAVREALRELLRANNGVAVDEAAAAATLDAAARRAGLAVRFDNGAIRLAPRETRRPGRARAACSPPPAEAMADGSWQRLKACRSDTCRWAFVDNARNHSRQWCSMSVCGNRQKARVFRERHA